jgi:hypothetical protein
MAPGTLAGGLQTLASLFEPLEQAFLQKLRAASHWHTDETRLSLSARSGGQGQRSPQARTPGNPNRALKAR